MRPLSSRTMRSAMRKALGSSWVTTMMVMPKASFNLSKSWSIPAAMMGSRPGASEGTAFFHSAAELCRHVVFITIEADFVQFQANHDFDGGGIEIGVFV